jgi:hypothetical protein
MPESLPLNQVIYKNNNTMSLTLEEVRLQRKVLDTKRQSKQITATVYNKETERILSQLETGGRPTTRRSIVAATTATPSIPIIHIMEEEEDSRDISVFTEGDCSSYDEDDLVVEEEGEVDTSLLVDEPVVINFKKRSDSGRGEELYDWYEKCKTRRETTFFVPENTQRSYQF